MKACLFGKKKDNIINLAYLCPAVHVALAHSITGLAERSGAGAVNRQGGLLLHILRHEVSLFLGQCTINHQLLDDLALCLYKGSYQSVLADADRSGDFNKALTLKALCLDFFGTQTQKVTGSAL